MIGGMRARGRLRELLAARPAIERTARNAWRSVRRFVEPERAVVEEWVDFAIRTSTEHEWRMLTGAQLVNSGCWVSEPAFLGPEPRRSPYRVGFAVRLQNGRGPELVNLLD